MAAASAPSRAAVAVTDDAADAAALTPAASANDEAWLRAVTAALDAA